MNAIERQVLSATEEYYDAFARCDLAATMACWADRDDISCVAPIFDPGLGRRDVEEIYRRVYEITAGVLFSFEVLDTTLEDPLAVVTCGERLTDLTHGYTNDFLSSNMFVLDGTGWRLLHRHVSWRAAREVQMGPP